MDSVETKGLISGIGSRPDSISVVIVNWNGKNWLQKCMACLAAQDCENFEVVVVDNDSNDGSVEFLAENHPDVRVVRNDSNAGFALASNIGIREARGEYVLLLNNDTTFDSDFLSRLRSAFLKLPNLGAVQPKVVLMSDNQKLEACGYYWTRSTFLYPYGYRKPASLALYEVPKPFFSLTGAALMLPRDVLDRLGAFDEDFFCYYEDTDLCNRLWLSGLQCWYFPEAEIQHAVGGTSHVLDSGLVHFHYHKNRISSIIKNFESRRLASTLGTFYILNSLLGLLRLALGRPDDIRGLVKATWYVSRNIGRILEKRKTIQVLRETSDAEIFTKVGIKPGFRFYLERLAPHED